MATFSIVVDTASLYSSSSGTVWGSIHVEVDERAFPEKAWSDMPTSILTGWIEEFIALRGRGRGQSRFFFADGPFQFRIKTDGAAIGTVELEERDVVVFTSTNVAFQEIGESMVSAAAQLLSAYPSDGSELDLDSLRNSYLSLMSNLGD